MSGTPGHVDPGRRRVRADRRPSSVRRGPGDHPGALASAHRRGDAGRPAAACSQQRGYLSGLIIDETEDLPSSSAYRSRFGSLLRAYQLVGFTPDRDYRYIEINRALRAMHPDVVADDDRRDPAHAAARCDQDPDDRPPDDQRRVHRVDRHRPVPADAAGSLRWHIRFDTGLAPDITVAVRMDADNRHRSTTTCCRARHDSCRACAWPSTTACRSTPIASTRWSLSSSMAARVEPPGGGLMTDHATPVDRDDPDRPHHGGEPARAQQEDRSRRSSRTSPTRAEEADHRRTPARVRTGRATTSFAARAGWRRIRPLGQREIPAARRRRGQRGLPGHEPGGEPRPAPASRDRPAAGYRGTEAAGLRRRTRSRGRPGSRSSTSEA